MALLANGTVVEFGELGETTNSSVPVEVKELSGVSAISTGGSHSSRPAQERHRQGRGENQFGELGDGTSTSSAVPVEVKELSGVSAISAGAYHSLALARLPLTATTAGLAEGQVNVAYSQALTASGGSAPYTWSLTGGSLPAGLSLNPESGAITGTPTAPGTSSFTVRVSDSSSPTPQSATASLSITVLPLTITTTALAEGQLNVAYSQALTAAGGSAPYTWSLTGGSLPAGLSLNPESGAITGTPTAPGTSSFTVRVSDSSTPTPQSATASLSITVLALTVTSAELPGGEVGVGYSRRSRPSAARRPTPGRSRGAPCRPACR